jgi:cytochrome c biogenesis protein CcdA
VSAESESVPEPRQRRRRAWGIALIVLGVLTILGGVEYVLLQVDGRMVHEFAERTTYRQAKTAIHRAYPIGLAIALAGLALALLGGRLTRK